MKFIYDDGGREKTGFKGTARDCVVRAIAIAANLPYQKVYFDLKHNNTIYSESRRDRIAKILQKKGTSSRNGNFKQVYHNYILSLGFNWVPTMKIGQGCKIHLRENELPTGTLIVKVSRHLTAVINGVIHDTYDCSREGTRCVYGYYCKN